MLYLPLTPILLFSEAREEYPVLLVSFLVGFVFYFGVALLFRRAAR
jgi:hypothetical protein